MKIGIIGLGFVGDAMKFGCEHFGFTDISVYDPHKIKGSKITDIENTDIVFICVPTPMGAGGKIDDTIIINVFKELSSINYTGIAVIKSTLLPTCVYKIKIQFSDLKIVTNPEFLTERKARQDFINSEWVVLGGDDIYTEILQEFYINLFPQKMKIARVSAEAAMMAKYMTNTWFSVKVSLMNEFYHLWQKIGNNDWHDVVEAFAHDSRVGPTHLDVPGPDGDFGFGGKCFPKDLNALKSLADNLGTVQSVMQAAWNDNKKFRNNKDWLTIDGAVSNDYKE